MYTDDILFLRRLRVAKLLRARAVFFTKLKSLLPGNSVPLTRLPTSIKVIDPPDKYFSALAEERIKQNFTS